MNSTRVGLVQGQRGASVLTGAVVKAREAMANLKETRWAWWGIPALLIVAVTIVTVVAYSYADCQYIYQLRMDHYASSPGQGGRAPEVPTPLMITMADRVARRVISIVISWLVWAGALFLILLLLGHGGVRFGSVWTLVVWAWIPHAVRGIVQSIYMTAVGRPVYNQGLAGLVVDKTPPPMMTFVYDIPTPNRQALASLLSRLDIYLVWQLVLMVMGVTALTTLSRGKARVLVVGLWLLFTLVAMVPAFFPGTFSRFRYF